MQGQADNAIVPLAWLILRPMMQLCRARALVSLAAGESIALASGRTVTLSPPVHTYPR